MHSTSESIIWWQEKSVWVMLFLGFSAGVPILLIFSSLSLWLREAGVSKSAVTFFSWAALGYSFKFVWAPLVDKLPLPLLSQWLGRRRGWLLLSQCAVIAAIVWMATTDPHLNLMVMAFAAVLLGFSSATQDIVIDAFRIESASPRLQAMLSSTYIAGYRIGMIAAGAGALYLAQWFGSSTEQYNYLAWRNTYLCMAGLMLIGVLTTLLISEPEVNSEQQVYPYSTADYLRFFLVFLLAIAVFIVVFVALPDTPKLVSGYAQKLFAFGYSVVALAVAIMGAFVVARLCLKSGLANPQLVDESYRQPIADFFQRYGKLAIWVLLLVGFYRVSDIVMGVVANLFYQDMGYSKSDIASVTKVFGVLMTIVGSFLGGLLALRIGVMRVLLLGAGLAAITNLLFMWLSNQPAQILNLTIVIAADNLSAGIAVAAFVAWLSSLTNVSFTATQYAIFSSLMTLFPKLLGGYSGTMVESMGYGSFFLFTACLGLPVILLILFLDKRL